LAAEIRVTLPPAAAYLEIAPTIRNLAGRTLLFDYWQTAMLAPGRANRPSAGLHFVLPSPLMTVHSTGDTALPGPGQQFTWPRSFGRDLSRLATWDQYLGFFEYPAAHGPFVGVYDTLQDAGVVRAFPANVTRGSKVFGLGWRRAIGSEDFTDDGSSYVELHAGLAPTFAERSSLPARAVVAWDERWYPVQGIGDLTYAGREVALSVQSQTQGLHVTVYAPAPLAGALVVQGDGTHLRRALQVGPDAPVRVLLAGLTLAQVTAIQVEGAAGRVLLDYVPERY
jgi:hypothetical protein